MHSLREGSYVEWSIVIREKKKRRKPIYPVIALILIFSGFATALVIMPENPAHSWVWVRGTDGQTLQNWSHYVFHLNGTDQNRTNLTKVIFGLQSDPGAIFDGTLAPYFNNQTAAEFLSTLVNNYTGFFDNASGGGHWLLKEIATGAVNGSMINVAYQIYQLHPELYTDMDFLFMLAQTKNFQDGLNATDKQVLANEVATWDHLQPFEKRSLLFFPVNETVYEMSPGDLLYLLETKYAKDWNIDPSNVTQGKILFAYDAVFDGYLSIKPVANADSEFQFLMNYIDAQAPAIGLDYLKLIAGMPSGVLGIMFKIEPVHVQYSNAAYTRSDNPLAGAQFEKAFTWVNSTPRGYPNAYADARAFWNANDLNSTVVVDSKIGTSKDPVGYLFGQIYTSLSNGSSVDDPGPNTFNQLFMKYYLNLTNGVRMDADCSSISPLVWYLINSQNYVFVLKNSTLTKNPHDPNVIGPFVVSGVVVKSHIGNNELDYNTTTHTFGLGNTPTVMDQIAQDPTEYHMIFPSYARFLERKYANDFNTNVNVPGLIYQPYYNRKSIKVISNITPINIIQRETLGEMVDHYYNSAYGWDIINQGGTPFTKYNITGSNFPPIYRGIPTDEKVTGEPQVGSTVPEFSNVFMAAVAPVIYLAFRRFKRR